MYVDCGSRGLLVRGHNIKSRSRVGAFCKADLQSGERKGGLGEEIKRAGAQRSMLTIQGSDAISGPRKK